MARHRRRRRRLKRAAVLIVGQRPDPHIDEIAGRLERLGVRALVFDRYHPNHAVSLRYGGTEVAGRFDSGGSSLTLEDVGAVWWRVKPALPAEFSGGAGGMEEAFRVSEWKTVLRSLPSLLPRARWVNPLDSGQRYSHKPAQLALAAELGLRIPDTIITNSSRDVLPLFANGEVVYKTTASFLSPPDEIVFTNRVDRRQIESSSAAIALAPGIFQSHVAKSHELRATVIGDEVFTVKIDSQSGRRTKTDWRRDQGRAMYSRGALSRATLQKLRRFHKRSGLVYGAYDFIVTESGEEVFLECNPGGQWLWLERALGLRISETLAGLLAGIH